MWSTALLLVIAACSVSATQRVAVIGGGVAGASAAHYIRQAIGEASIEVFERNQLGGRAQEQDCDGVLVELGASIVWHKNYLVKDLAAAAGLECVSPPSDGLLAVYDGKELVFEQSTWGIVSLLRLILRYGFSWWSFRSAPAAMFEKFTGIYPLLDNGTTFDRPEQLLKAVGLYEYTQASLFEYLRENYGSSLDLLAKELIAGVNKVNYNQNNMQINALAGHVSLLPATEPSVFKIKGGNSQLASRVLQVANATVHCPAAVAAVQRLADGRFQLELQKQAGHGCPAGDVQAGAGQCAESPSGATAPQPFDAVVVATPLEGSGLTFPGVHLPVIPARKFQQTVTTVIKGAVRPSYFGLSAMTYSAVMVTEEAAVPWSSLSLLGRTASDNVTLWKLFSSERLPHAWTEMMFEAGYEVVANRTWNAYPQFDPPEDMAPFKLADGLFYAAALENAASAMEVAAIEGRMTAALAVQHLRAAAAAQQAGQGPQLVQAGAERAAEAGAAAAA